ncbi:MAG: hypothetical protein V5A68_04400, partial [Candidatus Thermoplasmatota archaeon]
KTIVTIQIDSGHTVKSEEKINRAFETNSDGNLEYFWYIATVLSLIIFLAIMLLIFRGKIYE